MLKTSLFAAALLTAGVQAASATEPPGPAKTTYTINFVDHCDGMTLNVYKGIFTTGVSTGCLSTLDQGLYTTVKNFNGLVVTGLQNSTSTLYTYALNFITHKYIIYVSNGTTYSVLAKGFFTIGAAADAGSAGKTPSIQPPQ